MEYYAQELESEKKDLKKKEGMEKKKKRRELLYQYEPYTILSASRELGNLPRSWDGKKNI